MPKDNENKYLSSDALIFEKIEPSRIALGWEIEETSEGYILNGELRRHNLLNGQELLEYGVFDISGQGMPVHLRPSVETDKDYNIISIDIQAYASNGPAYGKPIYVSVTEEDDIQVTKELARFLVEPQLGDGKLVEDKRWIKGVLPKFKEMSEDLFLMSKELSKFDGNPISFDKATKNGWIVDKDEGLCYGYFELITDLDRMSFWMGIAIQVDESGDVIEVKCVLKDDEPPTPEEIDDFDQHEMVEGFNFARIVRFLNTIINMGNSKNVTNNKESSGYTGELKNGVRHGKGTYVGEDGSKYVGNWKDDQPDGQGTSYYPDGTKYVGEYKSGKGRHGQGTLYNADGTIAFTGQWRDHHPEAQQSIVRP